MDGSADRKGDIQESNTLHRGLYQSKENITLTLQLRRSIVLQKSKLCHVTGRRPRMNSDGIGRVLEGLLFYQTICATYKLTDYSLICIKAICQNLLIF